MIPSCEADERVEVPLNKVALLEFAGLVFDTCFVLEDELEVGCRTSLDKTDKYFYKTISTLLTHDARPYIPFK